MRNSKYLYAHGRHRFFSSLCKSMESQSGHFGNLRFFVMRLTPIFLALLNFLFTLDVLAVALLVVLVGVDVHDEEQEGEVEVATGGERTEELG